MSTNLPPEYFEADKRYRAAKTPGEKISCIQELLRIVPKLKGTDKLRAGLRKRLSKLKTTTQTKKGTVGRESAFRIEQEGAGQVVLIGPANVGKSALVSALTNATPEVADFPYTTWKPTPGMMPMENIQIQLVDTPPINRDFMKPELLDLIRRSDYILLVVDLQKDPDHQLQSLMDIGSRIYHQQRNDKNKIYSVHAPEVECISKGKVHKRYEFGCKVSVAATSRGGWFVGAKAYHGNPYDGHTLKDSLEQVNRVSGETEHAFVDMGYRGHNYRGDTQVHVDKRRRGRTAKSLWRRMKRRAAIEPGIGHLKRKHRMDRNRLKGVEGDLLNAILSAAGMNFWKLLKKASDFLRQIFLWLQFCQRTSFCQIPGKI